MRKLVESTFTTLDGVISDPHTWGPHYWDDEHAGYAHDLLFAADALVLGRETYEAFAEAWPSRPSDGDFTDRINAMPKHVASRTLSDADTTWNASIIHGDAADGVAALKSQAGENLLKYGTGELDRVLLEHKLVDEYHFWVFPMVAGTGQRLFDGFDTTHLELLETTPFKSGIVVHTYGPK